MKSTPTIRVTPWMFARVFLREAARRWRSPLLAAALAWAGLRVLATGRA